MVASGIVGSLLAVPTSAELSLPVASDKLRAVFEGTPPKVLADLRAMQEHSVRLAAAVKKCTVSVQHKAAHGSGVICSRDGYVLTAAHVVGQPNQIVQVRLWDGRIVQGRSLGMHRELDAGLVELLEPGPWDHLRLSADGTPPVGLWCLAVGHPGGYNAERGAVVRLGRVLSSTELIRTDCQLVGGDSGGPLVDMEGRVIGIHSRIGASLSNNLHVPIDTFRDNWQELIAGKLWKSRSFIGLRGKADSELPQVAMVHVGSPAEQAGVHEGDIIQRLNGETIDQFADLVRLVRQTQPGESVRLSVRRGDEELEFDIVVGRLEK